MAIKVKLLQKKISQGRKSLYLDFYPAIPNPQTGEKTRREFLKMYIHEKPSTALDKQHNAEQLKLGEAIRQKRENELNKPEIYSEYEKERLRKKELGYIDFVEYFRKTANKRYGSNRSNWMSALTYLENFTGGKVKFIDVTEGFLEDFKDYLLTTQSIKSSQKKEPLSQNSALSYFNKLKATLKQAYKEGILQIDLNARVAPIKPAETRREYLTLEELKALAKTPCSDDVLRCAALFSGLTGLRFSDIDNLDWGDIEHVEGQGYFIKFRQQKTKGIETLPISEEAYGLLREPLKSGNKVFMGLKTASYHKKALRDWIEAAGITKHITFHCFRHTYATLQLFKGTDMYTVSKMLGHREIKTTQIYAHIVDDAKREAADKIKLDL
ncbi:MAG: site-specific integrase [Rikenellaceae bacterium]|nr:site-specific integrase [Rikenellaceae bacterium]MCL2692071.1 site-specific integrase [Rikenellaceae bacterium]